MKIKSDDAEIYYEVLGDGPPVVLLHAFPVNHRLWQPAAERLASRYRVVLMDLRGHGESQTGKGPATMEKHAADLSRVCDACGIGRAIFGGVSIGGYVLFEFWRRSQERVRALILANTRAQADAQPAQAARLQAAADVERKGPDAFLDSMAAKLLGQTTQTNRPDLVEAVHEMMSGMTVSGIAAVQRGMAVRPDSMATLGTINVPTLLLFAAEDMATPVAEGELIRQEIAKSQLQVVPRAGHLAVFEQQDSSYECVRKFLDRELAAGSW